jgi:asparagine synthetase B (glutamine-hydrolysing)
LLFACATFSAHDRAIEITRTLIGGRQVYYATAPNGDFFCASHVRLLRSAGVRLEEDPERLPEMFVYRYVSPPRTPFKGVDQLVAGERRRFTFDGRSWAAAPPDLYSPPFPDDRQAGGPAPRPAGGENGNGNGASATAYSAYGDRTRDALRNAMLALAPASDQLHVLASGGLDSSILFKLAQTDFGLAQGYSTGYPFEEEADDVEKKYALTAAEAFGARHSFFVPTTRQFQVGLLEAVAAAEEPVVHTQSILMHLMFRDGLPAGEGTVAVGQGADGAFGMRIHRLVGRVDRFRASHPRLAGASRPALGVARPLLRLPPVWAAARTGLRWLRRDPGVLDLVTNRWGDGVDLADPQHVLWRLGATGLFSEARRHFHATRRQAYANRLAVLAPFAGRPILDALSLLDFLSDVSVTQGIWSKSGEAARKVVYYPFNARELLDCVFATPWAVKLAEPKGVLRDVARKLGVPEFIVSRPKANFNATSNHWALRGGVFEPFVPLAAKVFREKDLRRMQSTRSGKAFTFWSMINYAIWRRLFLEGESLGTLMEELDRASAGADPPPTRRAPAASR